jgi:hypothetical protein
LVKRETAGVDALRAGRTNQRAINAGFIKMIALLNGAQYCFVIRRSTLRTHLVNTAARANFWMRI